MAEKLAIEAALIRIPKLRKISWTAPLIFGFLFAIIFSAGLNPIIRPGLRVSATPTFDFSWSDGICAAIGFVFGLGGGCLWQKSVRSKILEVARRQALKMHQKLGAQRSFSWNSDSLTVSTPMMQTQINWRIIDRIENGEVGIHGVSSDYVMFRFPKGSLPPDLLADDLIKVWQGYISKPPTLK